MTAVEENVGLSNQFRIPATFLQERWKRGLGEYL